MTVEWFDNAHWHKLPKWFIEPHKSRTLWQNYKGEECIPECQLCKKKIEYGDAAYYCLIAPIRLRPQGQRKVCENCGNNIKAKFKKCSLSSPKAVYEKYKKI